MPHRRPSSPFEDEQAAVNLRRSASDTSKPQRFLAKLKHANLASSSSNTPAPPPSLPLPTQSSPGAVNPSPGTPAKLPSTQSSAQMHRLGTPLPQIQIQNNHLCPHSSLSMSNPTAASASSISLASTLVGSGMGNPSAPGSTANVPSGAGSSSINPSLGPGADRDPWHLLHFHVLPIFNGEMLRIPIEDLNELVSKHISNVIARAPARAVTTLEHDVESLLARGMTTLNVRVAEVDDTKLIPRLVDTWLLFWHRVLPYVEGILLPIKTEKPMQALTKMPKANRPPSPTTQSLTEETTPITPHPSSHLHTHSVDVRALSLCSFRDAIVQPVYSRLLGLLNAGLGVMQGKDKEKDKEREKDPDMTSQRIQQMLLVLLSVSHSFLPSSQSQFNFPKSPKLSPDVNPPPHLLTPPLSTSRPNFNAGFGSSAVSSPGGSALGIVTTPTSSATMFASSSSDNALSVLLNALRNPSSTLTTASNGQGGGKSQFRVSQPFLISRNNSFLTGSGPRDRRGRIGTRKPNNNDHSAPPLELELKSKSEPSVTSPTSATTPNRSHYNHHYDQWGDDETPRNTGFKHEFGNENPRYSYRTHETQARSRSDGTLQDHDHDALESEGDGDGYDEDGGGGGYESYSDDTRDSFPSSGPLLPAIRSGLSNGMGTIKRSRRASASEVDRHGS